MRAGKIIAAIGLAIGIAALFLQFGLTIPKSMDQGRSAIGSIVFFFTFFTILTNIGAVLAWTAELVQPPRLRFFREPVHRAALAAAICFVMIFYHVMLAKIWAPEGLWKLADITLHYVQPTLYLIWWLGFVAHRQLDLGALTRMLAYPVLYVIWAMARGAVVDEYPYPVLEAHKLGYAEVLANISFLFILFVVLCALVVGLDKVLPQRSISTPPH